MESEILSDEELAEITGYKAMAWQRRWLKDREWVFIESRGRRPLVGRQYARMKLGILPDPSVRQPPALPTPAWTPDFSRVS
ncbi:DUF4224 domain-containing protein [Pseudomonas panipatensis]|uniref:DUF4224 domain-containing protein n=1 Tax=Pseudomonas panipatensis TaxID=428992 RepID=A0A1G8I9U8_9PSED|nr:DUF4224 domain-containing protein [Pseudomonas panipatensis]SDI15654.1 protein of unknown function [Pseudomonas panipatensis]SMP79125.1 protein of unknown function [Pseudomonas panipatensis]